MRCVTAMALVVAGGLAGGLHTQEPAAKVTRIGANGFTLPEGFTIELVAGPPLVERPISIDFDEKGRLYVTESSGSNENTAIQLAKKPHRILRLEDVNGDGVYDKRTLFAEGVMFPEGAMWHRGSLYVAAPPSIWKFTDADDDGVAETRVEWFQGKTLTGCANDLHGPYLGPDGWIYWCKGAFAPQTYAKSGNKPLATRASHVFRTRRDGSGLEHVITGGMDNPVDLAFLPDGEFVFSNTFIQYPAGGKRDGLLHAAHGGIYGKEFLDVLAPHPWTRPQVMPVLAHLGPAAPCGLTSYESPAFGPAFQGNLFTCLFNLRKVTRHELTPDGASYTSKDSDFLVSDHKEFHPTDVIEDADGSLLVVDTGGWYKLCCPTSQLVRPDVLGGIYRIRKTGAPKLADPRGERIAWATDAPETLAKLLGDARPFVRRRAKETLEYRGPAAIPALEAMACDGPSPLARREALWTLVRIDDARAREPVRSSLRDPDASVRQVAVHCVSRRRDAGATPLLRTLLANDTPALRRAAAEALGRCTTGADVAPVVSELLDQLGRTEDAFLRHSLTYALIDLADAKATRAGLAGPAPVRRAVLVALESIPGGLTADDVASALDASDVELNAAAWWLAARHPEWGPAIAKAAQRRLAAGDRDVARLAQLAKAPAIQDLLADLARANDTSVRRASLAAMAQANPKEVPTTWLVALGDALKSPALRDDAVAVARALRLPKAAPPAVLDPLHALGHDAAAPPLVRLRALAAWPTSLRKLPDATFAFVRSKLGGDAPVETRALAVDVLTRSQLSDRQLAEIADALPAASPLDVDRLLELFVGARDDQVGARLADALERPQLMATLRPDGLARRTKDFGPDLRKRFARLAERLSADAAQQRERLESLLAKLPPGDARRGHAVFNNPKIACVACHTIGYLGGNTGPDLTRIGSIRTPRDLLESIVFPSASFVRGYEPLVVQTADGRSLSGLVKTETPDELVLVTGPDQEIRVPRREVEAMLPGRVSVMPAGLEQQLSPQEIADLVAFLHGCK